jgi:hypothetical protein
MLYLCKLRRGEETNFNIPAYAASSTVDGGRCACPDHILLMQHLPVNGIKRFE